MKLADTGKLVIFTPLFCQLLFSIVLVVLLFSAQDSVTKVAKSEEIISRCNILMREVLSNMLTVSMATSKDAEVQPGGLTKEMTLLRQRLSELVHVLESNPRQTKSTIDQLVLVTEEAAYLLESSYRGLAAGGMNKFSTTDRYERAGRNSLRNMIDTITTIMHIENESEIIDVQKKEKEQLMVKVYLGLAGAGGVTISALFAIFCIIYMRKRLKVINENTHRFAARQPLVPELSGSDELATLDRDLHAMDRAITEAMQRERDLIDNTAALVCSINREGNFQSINAFSRRLLGKEPEALLGKSLLDVVAPEDVLIADSALNTAANAVGNRAFEMRLQRGEKAPIDTAWSTFWSDEASSLFCVVSDITERKNVQRLKEDFINMISHDLRTPLMSLSVDLALITRVGESLPEATRGSIAGAEATVEQLIRLVNDLLDYEKLNAGKMPFDLADCAVSQLLTDARAEVEEVSTSLAIPLSVESIEAQVRVDREKFMQMLHNLLLIALRVAPEDSQVALSAVRQDKEIEFAVITNSRALASIPDLFAPFAPLPAWDVRAEHGTGLELAIAKLIAEGHAGFLDVQLTERGSKLSCRVPVTAAVASLAG